jgi:UDP-3-O-[3-hydroxymyristoyl] glucosamine N-acyltransferase
MADPRFFSKAGEFTVAAVAFHTKARLVNGTGDEVLSDVSPLSSADKSHLSFFDNRKYFREFLETKAGACFVRPEFVSKSPAGLILLVSDEPYHAYAVATSMFYPENSSRKNFVGSFSENSVIHPKSYTGSNVTIEDYAVVCEGAEIGEGSFIGSGSYIGRNVKIGNNCHISQRVTITHSLLGSNIIIHPGVSIGQDGFGFAMGRNHIKVPQLGRVIIENNVEIGANSTIDRGSGPDTVIGEGTKIDNLVQIGHNVRIGRNCVIVAQTGISGSTEFGDYVVAGGQTGFGGHIKIGSGAKIAAQAGVTRDIDAGMEVGGTPSVPLRQYHKQAIAVQKLVRNKKVKDD